MAAASNIKRLSPDPHFTVIVLVGIIQPRMPQIHLTIAGCRRRTGRDDSVELFDKATQSAMGGWSRWTRGW